MARVILRGDSLSLDCYNFIKMSQVEKIVKKATRRKDAEYQYGIEFVYQTATDVDKGTLDYQIVWYDDFEFLLEDFKNLQDQIDAQLGTPTKVEHNNDDIDTKED